MYILPISRKYFSNFSPSNIIVTRVLYRIIKRRKYGSDRREGRDTSGFGQGAGEKSVDAIKLSISPKGRRAPRNISTALVCTPAHEYLIVGWQANRMLTGCENRHETSVNSAPTATECIRNGLYISLITNTR